MAEWIDTSYDSNGNQRKNHQHQIEIDGLEIIVHRSIFWPDANWRFNCQFFGGGLDTDTKDLEEAKLAAVNKCLSHFEGLSNKVRKIAS
jgi:hypothetical protein